MSISAIASPRVFVISASVVLRCRVNPDVIAELRHRLIKLACMILHADPVIVLSVLNRFPVNLFANVVLDQSKLQMLWNPVRLVRAVTIGVGLFV